MFITECVAGSFQNEADLRCHFCPIGSYKTLKGNDRNCTSCPKGQTTENSGSTNADQCGINILIDKEYPLVWLRLKGSMRRSGLKLMVLCIFGFSRCLASKQIPTTL